MLCMIEAPAVEPISLDKAKRWLKIDSSDEDEIIHTLIISARLYIEQVTQSLLIRQSWKVIFSDLDVSGRYVMPLSPVQNLSAATLRYSDDSERTLNLLSIRLDKNGDESMIIMPEQYRSLPTDGARFELDVNVGYGPNPLDVPGPIRTALLMLISHWYENRGDYSTHVNLAQIPSTILSVLSPFKRLRIA